MKSHNVRARPSLTHECFELNPGETVEVQLNYFEYKINRLTEINRLIEKVYYQYHEPSRVGSSVFRTVDDLTRAVYRDAYVAADKSYAGQVFEDDAAQQLRLNKIYSLSWTNGLSVSVPLLLAGIRLKNSQVMAQATLAINNIVDHCLNSKNGLPFGARTDNGEWTNRGWWFDGMHTSGHSAYQIGQAIYYLVKACQANQNGADFEKWRDFSFKVLQIVKTQYNSDYEFPYIFSETSSAGLEYDSLGSSWILAAMAKYATVFKNEFDLQIMLRSEQHYYDHFIAQLEGYGGPLDTDKATDSEGVLAYIRTAHLLHVLTHQDYLLGHLRDALEYEFTFKFCYNSPIKTAPLNRIGWTSVGGSVTSIANPHIHPMSNTVIDDIDYYLECRSNQYLASRQHDMIAWGCQTYNRFDNEYDYGKKGWMSERFCYSQGLLTQKDKNGHLASTWFCLMPWASASIIDGLIGKVWDKEISSNK